MNWTRTHALLGGISLILLVNAVALGGVAWNRSGNPDSLPRLSERELEHNGPDNENSGQSLNLNWRTPCGECRLQFDPRKTDINSKQMVELGFRMPEQVDDNSARQFDRQQSRAALLVLELDGPLYQRELQVMREGLDEARQAAATAPDDHQLAERLKHSQSMLEYEEKYASRLLLKDVGIDQQALRQRYPDRQRYLIVQGRVRPISLFDGHIWTLGGTAIDIGASINVPHRYRQVLEDDDRWLDLEKRQRFTAAVAFGQRLEPWIEGIEPKP